MTMGPEKPALSKYCRRRLVSLVLAVSNDWRGVKQRSSSLLMLVLYEWLDAPLFLTERRFCLHCWCIKSPSSSEDDFIESLDCEPRWHSFVSIDEWLLALLLGDGVLHSSSESIWSCLIGDISKLMTDEEECRLNLSDAASWANASLGVLKGVSSSMIWTSPHTCWEEKKCNEAKFFPVPLSKEWEHVTLN